MRMQQVKEEIDYTKQNLKKKLKGGKANNISHGFVSTRILPLTTKLLK